MIVIADELSKTAQSLFSLANTPLFTVNRLKEKPEVVAMSQLRTQEELLESLDGTLNVVPSTLAERAAPYVFLAALSLKNPAALRKYLNHSHPPFRWFDRSIEFFSRSPSSSNNVALFKPVLPSPNMKTFDSSVRILLP